DQKIEQFEARLIKTDMGVTASSAICEEIRKKHGGRTVILDEIEETVKEKIRTLLEGEGDTKWDITDPLSPLNQNSDGVTVILVAGVNGVGKTTSIAKLANLILKQNKTVLLAAGDTFRAAAVEQLTMWANRLGCEIVTRPDGTDPASVAYSGCERALETGVDYL
ncbi:MAG TPA: signal recognition particle-docking protein FtsY, partial [Planctomycetaceae bacterium]|nr:signal recognition particle-docking protein FtsY [Planctomycetaceae bacterium]